MTISTLVLMTLGASAAAAEERPIIAVPPCETMLHMVDTGFNRQAIGRGSAIAVVFFVIVLVITLLQRRFLREEEAA